MLRIREMTVLMLSGSHVTFIKEIFKLLPTFQLLARTGRK